ncbi:hypothetical protein ACI65C_006031 [Semiaphis heraclei]
MTPPVSMGYVEAKSRVVHGIDRITSFIAAAGEYKADPQNTAKRAKIEQMVRHLNEICRNVEANIQLMETAVSHGTTPTDITDTKYKMRSTHKEKNDELANIEELEKQRVCTEQVRVTNRDADNENLVSKDLKSDSDEDVTSGSESNAGSEAYCVTGAIRIKDPKKKKLRLLQRLSSLNAFFADTSEPVSLFSHEREQIEKEKQQNYTNLHIQGNREQAPSDLTINVADEAIRTKKESEKGGVIDITGKLETYDFCLIIMDPGQRHLLQTFGQGKVVCLDGTHGLNGYDFELVTLMVIDDFGSGFPCCFMCTNWKDTKIYTIMFTVIYDVTGIIKPQTFMTDIVETFYSAWETVMGPVPRRIFLFVAC